MNQFQFYTISCHRVSPRVKKLTVIQHLTSFFIRSGFLIEDAQDELGAIMPRGKVGQIQADHLGGVVEFCLSHTTPIQCLTLQAGHNCPPVAPAKKVAAVTSEHLTHQSQLLFPQSACRSWWEVQCSLFEEPQTVVPYPVALWELQ